MNMTFASTPIAHSYARPDADFVRKLQLLATPVTFPNNSVFVEENTYFKAGYTGTIARMQARLAVIRALEDVARLVDPGAELVIFDAFRTRATQRALFDLFYRQIAASHPDLSPDDVHQRTRQFVAHPDEVSRFAVAPHNSGGAVDLTLRINGQDLDMGTGFDEATERSQTDWFERPWIPETGVTETRWLAVRHNRRLLFNAMKTVGFVNYHEEWWHYDLGDCIWSAEHGVDWYFDSMELGTAAGRIA